MVSYIPELVKNSNATNLITPGAYQKGWTFVAGFLEIFFNKSF